MEQDEAIWAAHIDAQTVSGETQRAYCTRHGLAPRSFRAWRTRLHGPQRSPSRVDGYGEGEAEDGASHVACPLPRAAASTQVLGGPLQRRRWSDEEKRRLVYEGLRSGMGLGQFARQSGLQPSMIFRWRNTFAQFVDYQPKVVDGQPSFAMVNVSSSASCHRHAAPASPSAGSPVAGDTIEILLTSGCQVRVGRDVDAAALRRVLSVLESST